VQDSTAHSWRRLEQCVVEPRFPSSRMDTDSSAKNSAICVQHSDGRHPSAHHPRSRSASPRPRRGAARAARGAGPDRRPRSMNRRSTVYEPFCDRSRRFGDFRGEFDASRRFSERRDHST
jgi:hypothetical protein